MRTISCYDDETASHLLVMLARPGNHVWVVGAAYRLAKSALEAFVRACDERERSVRRDVDSFSVKTNGAVVTASPIGKVRPSATDWVVVMNPDVVSDEHRELVGLPAR